MSRRRQSSDPALIAGAQRVRCASDTNVQYGRINENNDMEEEEEEVIRPIATHQIPKTIGQYQIRGTVGEGSFSIVKLAYLPESKKYFACKIIEKGRLQHNDLQKRFECEIRVHQQMHHPGIVELFDLLHDQFFYYVILEFCPGGELFQYIVDRGRLSEDVAKPIMVQILSSLAQIHKLGVSHRDLKPENLLLDQVGHTKISDFGLSRFVDSNGLAHTPCGSPCYAAPECISGEPYDGRKSDCWSCGVIFYAMVTGQLPWTKRNQNQLFEQIRRGEYTIPAYISKECRDFIQKLMCVSDKKRLSAAEALQHVFLNSVSYPLPGLFSSETPVISLRRVDSFFGETSSFHRINLTSTSSQHSITFDKAIHQIMAKNGKKYRKNTRIHKKRHLSEVTEKSLV